jgi:rhamnogalacturonan endolyase
MGPSSWWRRLALVAAALRRSLRRVRTDRRQARLAGRPRLLLEPLETRTVPSFGISISGSNYVVDTGANVIFKVARSNADITSITYQGTELTAPHSITNRYSHYESGLSSTHTTITTSVNLTQGTAILTASDSSLGVTQYYVALSGYNNIYMATYAGGSTPPTPGEMRYIFYLDRSIFNVDPYSDINGLTAIEGSDVYADPSTGYTYSKFYSSQRNIDDPYHGVTGTGIGAFMMIGSREKGSGGPFFKDIAEQGTSAEELYNYMYSGHEQTEAFRSGLQGPYALEITDGSNPAALDYSFMDNLGISGWVAASGRGTVSGNATGVPAAYTVTVGLSNSGAQYWTTADSTGAYSISGILPGTYTMTLYANELAVGSRSVTISAGNTTNADVQDTATIPTPIFGIGTWDGTPNEFMNEPALNTEHPSDPRLSAWNNVSFVVGTNVDSDWPAAQWKDVNNDNQIVFNLTPAQAAVANTLRIGITDAFAGGRPQIAVNTGQPYHWNSALPSPSSQPNSRSITRGTYRGNNTTFTYNIPRSALVAGTNTIDISVNSGTTGTSFLSPAIVYDAIDLRPTASGSGSGPMFAAIVPSTAASPPASLPGDPAFSLPVVPSPSGGNLLVDRVLADQLAAPPTTLVPGQAAPERELLTPWFISRVQELRMGSTERGALTTAGLAIPKLPFLDDDIHARIQGRWHHGTGQGHQRLSVHLDAIDTLFAAVLGDAG